MKLKRSDFAIFFLLVFIFVNNVGLSFGLQWTMFLAPFLFFNTVGQYKKIYFFAGCFWLIYFLLQFIGGIESYQAYFRSSALHFAILILSISFHKLINRSPQTLFKAFDKATRINFYLAIVAVILLFLGVKDLWTTSTSTGALNSALRLRMFTYEPSYYSLLLVPLFYYKYLKFYSIKSISNFIPVLIIIFPLLLSLSMGVIVLIAFTIILISVITTGKNRVLFIVGLVMLGAIAFVLFISFPDSIFVSRISQIVSGNDVSGNARIIDPWTISYQILEKQHRFFTGIGWGHISIVGHDVIQNFYGYSDSTVVGYDLPNICCEILTILGFPGLFLFLYAQIYFYRKTKVSKSYYRKYLFWFIFIYQFTGSYSSSLLHYSFLVMAYSKPVDVYLLNLFQGIKERSNRNGKKNFESVLV